ncbi:XRE family transcriptional regulator [Streptomyces albus]|uniref:helix-turn-helix domain-containing protein n=1 Tax=Streptomyces albus TaxID=1888 RepID=UPI00099C587D|nr:XRE family transcriptional regulator [Streptomyces albus]
MPRWKVLPEELDPQIREFTGQLRRIVELSGLGVGSVADRTGYSKTSWDRYLNGRLLPPLGAVVALAEVTGYAIGPLTAQWERAEAAWARAEAGQEPATEPPPDPAPGRTASGHAPPGPGPEDAPPGRSTPGRGTPGRPAGHAGPGRTASERPDPGYPTPDTVALSVVTAPAGPGGGRDARSGSGPRPGGGARRALLFGLGLAGALAAAAGAVFFLDLGDDAPADGKARVATTPASTPEQERTELPEGVTCSGDDCTGEDPEEQGCGGEHAGTVTELRVGAAFVEMRHSEVCGAVWARITEAAPGDSVRVAVGERSESSEVAAGTGTQPGVTEAYTRMVAAERPSDAEVCATTAAGEKGCARPGAAEGSATSAPPGDGTGTGAPPTPAAPPAEG